MFKCSIILFFFHLFQFLSNFFKYSLLNFLSSYPYNNFAAYLSDNSSLLNSSASRFNFISFSFFIFILHISFSNLSFSNFSIFSVIFFKFSNFSYVFSFPVYPFYFTKYFVFSFLSCLSKISSTSYSFSPATSTGGSGIFFCSSTYSLYFTILLILTTRCIHNNTGNSNSTTFSNTIFLTIYGPINFSVNFFVALFINSIEKSFMLISILITHSILFCLFPISICLSLHLFL